MIKKGHKIDSIYKKGKEISKIVKKGQLVYTNGFPVESTFLTRTTAEGLAIRDDSVARVISIKGNTEIHNQKRYPTAPSAVNCTYEETDGIITLVSKVDGQKQIRHIGIGKNIAIANHIILILVKVYENTFANIRTSDISVTLGWDTVLGKSAVTVINRYNQGNCLCGILRYNAESDGHSVNHYCDPNAAGTKEVSVGEKIVYTYNIIDLTQWFGAGNEPATALEYAQRRGYNSVEELPYEEYNTGEVVSVNHLCLPPARKVSVEQKVVNGDFSNGLDGWTKYSGARNNIDINVVDGKLRVDVLNDTSGGDSTAVTRPCPYINGHVYFLGYRINITSVNALTPAVEGPIGSITLYKYKDSDFYYNIVKAVRNGSNIYIRPIGTKKVGDFWLVDDFSIYDLTDIFGEGNEPTTIDNFYRLCPWAKVYQPHGIQERYIGFGVEEKSHFVGKVNWNQVVKNGDFSGTTGWRAFNTTNSRVEIVNGMLVHTILTAGSGSYSHGASSNSTFGSTFPAKGTKVFLTYKVNPSKTVKMGCDVCNTVQAKSIECPQNTWTRCDFLLSAAGSSNSIHIIPRQATSVGDIFYYKDVNAFDLTQMFGEGNEPATAEEFYLWCPFAKTYQSYNVGEEILIGQKTLLPVNTSNFPSGLNGFNPYSGKENIQDVHTPTVDINNVGIVTLNGSEEGWNIYTYKEHCFSISSTTITNKDVTTLYKNMCRVLNKPSIEASGLGSVDGVYVSTSYVLIVSALDCSTLEEFKTKLSQEPLTMLWKRTVPVITPCFDLMQCKAFNQGVETVINSDIPITLDMKYKK